MKTVYVENYGCASNRFDLEVMLEYIGRANIEVINNPKLADVLLVNTCGVKKSTEDKVLGRLRLLSELGKPVIVSGCLPKINLSVIEQAVPNYSAVLDPYSVDKIVQALRGAETGEVNRRYLDVTPQCKIGMPKTRLNRALEIVQISEGCAGSCAFCCTRFARGRLFSYPQKLIVDRVRTAVDDGVKEFWITAQDTGCYGLDIGSSLTELLRAICGIEGEFFVRVGMMNPGHVLCMLDKVIEVYRNEKIFRFIHLPLQSGDDDVLKDMNRPYSVDDFFDIVHSFREAIPDITIATDMICGFPTEDDAAFEASLDVIKQIEPDVVNVSRFFPRPMTQASKLKRLPSGIVKERGLNMTKLCRDIARRKNGLLLDWTGWVLIDEIGKNRSSVGRNFAYKPIVVKKEEELGKILTVTVKRTFTTYVEGVRLE